VVAKRQSARRRHPSTPLVLSEITGHDVGDVSAKVGRPPGGLSSSTTRFFMIEHIVGGLRGDAEQTSSKDETLANYAGRSWLEDSDPGVFATAGLLERSRRRLTGASSRRFRSPWRSRAVHLVLITWLAVPILADVVNEKRLPTRKREAQLP